LSQAEFEAAEAAQACAADVALDAGIEAARTKGEADAARWDAIYRAAVCTAAQAIAARDWTAKRQALAVADQADAARQPVMAALFGRPKEVPAQYAALERAGATLTREDSSAALRVIAADRAAMRAQRKPGVR
jgi:hypothetical protein